MLARWWLRLSEFDFDIIHRAGMKNQAACALSRLEAEGKNCTDITDDVPVVTIDAIDVMSEASQAPSYTPCQLCDNKEQEPGIMMPKVQSYVQWENQK